MNDGMNIECQFCGEKSIKSGHTCHVSFETLDWTPEPLKMPDDRDLETRLTRLEDQLAQLCRQMTEMLDLLDDQNDEPTGAA